MDRLSAERHPSLLQQRERDGAPGKAKQLADPFSGKRKVVQRDSKET